VGKEIARKPSEIDDCRHETSGNRPESLSRSVFALSVPCRRAANRKEKPKLLVTRQCRFRFDRRPSNLSEARKRRHDEVQNMSYWKRRLKKPLIEGAWWRILGVAGGWQVGRIIWRGAPHLLHMGPEHPSQAPIRHRQQRD